MELKRKIIDKNLLDNGNGWVSFVDSANNKFKEQRFFDILKMDTL